MPSTTQNLKETSLNSAAIFTYFVSKNLFHLSLPHICVIVTYGWRYPSLYSFITNTSCGLFVTAVTAETRQIIQNLLTSFQECLRTGALVQSSVHLLIPSAAVLFRCSLYFPEPSGCDTDPCSLPSLMFVSINTEGIGKAVQETPFLEEKCRATGRLRQILLKRGGRGLHSWTRTSQGYMIEGICGWERLSTGTDFFL